jgi:hypothetical protein
MEELEGMVEVLSLERIQQKLIEVQLILQDFWLRILLQMVIVINVKSN